MTPPGLPRAPATPEALLRDPRHPGIVRHLRRDYVDPMSGGARLMLVRDQRGLVIGVHSASKLKPVRQIARELVVDAPSQASASVQPSYVDWIFWGPERPLLVPVPAGSASAPTRQ